MNDFDQANKRVHPVETQWHYPIMTANGFVAMTSEGTGFVRRYLYKHTRTGREIEVTTGVNSDYWSEENVGYGLWGTLQAHVEKINATDSKETNNQLPNDIGI